MKISEAISVCIIMAFTVFISVVILALFAAILLGICSVPVYLVCMIFRIEFYWLYPVVLAGIVALIFCMVNLFDGGF